MTQTRLNLHNSTSFKDTSVSEKPLLVGPKTSFSRFFPNVSAKLAFQDHSPTSFQNLFTLLPAYQASEKLQLGDIDKAKENFGK